MHESNIHNNLQYMNSNNNTNTNNNVLNNTTYNNYNNYNNYVRNNIVDSINNTVNNYLLSIHSSPSVLMQETMSWGAPYIYNNINNNNNNNNGYYTTSVHPTTLPSNVLYDVQQHEAMSITPHQ